VAAASWFATEVWPGVSARTPGVRWMLAGARPARAVRALARLEGVEVHGDVPDLGAFLASATVAIAPMSTGSGVPMKVLEAWAAGVPVVAHPWAAHGLASDPEGGVAVAAGREEWIEAVSELLADPGQRQRLAERGRAVWQQRYHPERVRDDVRRAVEHTVAATPA
jgi:glycosyltransferase involved in cell wall biosynthesis